MKRTVKKIIAAVLAAATLTTAVSISVFAEPDNTDVQPTTPTTYTGEEVTPPVSISDEGIQLQNGVDYDLTYENNINVGTATAIVTFKGNYSGERRIDFNIVARSLTNEDVTFSDIENQVFMNGAAEPKPTITVGDTTLTEGTDYDLNYENNTNVGTATVTAVLKGNYTGSVSTTFEIVAKAISNSDIESGALAIADVEAQTFTGSGITPEPAVTYNGITLVKDSDYTLSYENNVNVGTATINITFKGNYSGTTVKQFEITAKQVSVGEGAESSIVISDIPDQTYTGAAITPEPVITDVGR